MKTSYDALETTYTVYATNLYDGIDDDINDIEKYTSTIDMHVVTDALIDFTFTPTNATNDIYIRLYKRGDDNWTGKEIQWKSVILVENIGPEQTYHYTIPIAYRGGHYRFGIVSTGATTTFDILVTVTTFRETTAFTTP